MTTVPSKYIAWHDPLDSLGVIVYVVIHVAHDSHELTLGRLLRAVIADPQTVTHELSYQTETLG